MAAAIALTPRYGKVGAASLSASLYLLRNAVEAVAAYPIGAFSDRTRRTWLLAAGYALSAGIAGAAAAGFRFGLANLTLFTALFAAAGISAACKETMESAIPAAMITQKTRGTAYGVLGFVNGFGDLAASALTGMIWTAVSPAAAFTFAGLFMLLGSALMAIA